MKSIRISLVVYLLLLLGAAWGGASWLVYRSAAESLRAKEVVNHELLRKEFKEREREENERFDDELLNKAQYFAHLIQTRFERERTAIARLVALGLVNDEQAHLFTPLWMLQATTRGPAMVSPFTPVIARKLTTQIQINEADLPRDPDPNAVEFFQVNHEIGIDWPPTAPGQAPLFAIGTFDPQKHVESKVDDVVLAAGRIVRRVQLKFVPGTRFTIAMGRRRGPGGPLPADGSPPVERPQAPPPTVSLPWIVVHVAAEPARRDAAIARSRAAYEKNAAELTTHAQEELAQLRRRLALIGVGAFLATTLGGYFLVGIGLAPLRRLSEAVGHVSPRDFRLPLADDAALGQELAPIAGTLRETLDQLRRAFERERQSSADISHELRTPVASLLATLDVALRKPRTADEYRRTLVDCRGIGQQMRQLVERLMALARLDAGSDHVRPQRFDLAELVDEVAALVRPLALERGLDLRVQCPKDVAWTTDPNKLREILVNLLNNAIQYNRPNGRIELTAVESNGWLDLRVRDTGIGIAPETTERIFERFFRADPSRENSGLHAGLGLSIVQGYVKLLGGTVSVESQSGQGSTFRVRLPQTLAA